MPPTKSAPNESAQSEPAKDRNGKIPKNGPTKSLPTNRITQEKQSHIIRAYAACHESTGKPVTNQDVGEVVGLTGSTVSLANAFLTANGFLERLAEGGYTPSAAVMAFYKAHNWDAEKAPHKLRPLIMASWFAQALMPKLKFRQIAEKEALEDLGAAANAGPEYRQQLRMLLEYMEFAGVIVRENGQITLQPDGAEYGEPEKRTQVQDDPKRDVPSSGGTELNTSFSKNGSGAIRFGFQIDVDPAEVSAWAPERITAFFAGVAQVLRAKGGMELKEGGGV
jgi:hypothetical protein